MQSGTQVPGCHWKAADVPDPSPSPRSPEALPPLDGDATGRTPCRRTVFERDYRDHAGAVFGLARRLLWDRSLAEEVTQEVFLRWWRRPERFDPRRGTLRSFLLADCHGRSVDAIRSEAARRDREEQDGRSRRRHVVGDEADQIGDGVLHDEVALLLRDLPECEREAISLAFFGEATYVQVAATLGAPEGTVKSRIRSGLGRLRREAADAGILAR